MRKKLRGKIQGKTKRRKAWFEKKRSERKQSSEGLRREEEETEQILTIITTPTTITGQCSRRQKEHLHLRFDWERTKCQCTRYLANKIIPPNNRAIADNDHRSNTEKTRKKPEKKNTLWR